MSARWKPYLPRGVRLRHDALRNRHILVTPERIFEIDRFGVEILMRCNGRYFLTLLSDLAAVFEDTPEQIQSDVERFIKSFANKRVLDLGL